MFRSVVSASKLLLIAGIAWLCSAQTPQGQQKISPLLDSLFTFVKIPTRRLPYLLPIRHTKKLTVTGLRRKISKSSRFHARAVMPAGSIGDVLRRRNTKRRQQNGRSQNGSNTGLRTFMSRNIR